MQETKSNWAVVSELMKNEMPLALGRYASYWFHRTPRRMAHCLSYYKFAAKMIGHQKTVLDVGCNEGLGTYLLHKECGHAEGIDFDSEAIETARSNFSSNGVQFHLDDILKAKTLFSQYDAITSFDVIEHIYPEHVDQFWCALKERLTEQGLVVIGTPSLISQQFASEVSKRGHVNIYSHEQLEAEVRKHFHYSFFFAANDEVVHTGYLPLAHYFLIIGAKKKG